MPRSRGREFESHPLRFNCMVVECLTSRELDYADKNEFWGISQIRGAQDNGLFYVIEKNGKGYDLIGILSGNSYRYTEFNGKETFITTWHISASQFNQCLYQWDGKMYTLMSSQIIGDK